MSHDEKTEDLRSRLRALADRAPAESLALILARLEADLARLCPKCGNGLMSTHSGGGGIPRVYCTNPECDHEQKLASPAAKRPKFLPAESSCGKPSSKRARVKP
jgi:hypothetical protein